MDKIKELREKRITASSASAISYDEVIDLYHSVKTSYRSKAVFLANDSTMKVLRKLKDGSGQYLWQLSLAAGLPDTILGRPIESSECMPKIASAAKTMLFGDFSYYWIADRQARIFQRKNRHDHHKVYFSICKKYRYHVGGGEKIKEPKCRCLL